MTRTETGTGYFLTGEKVGLRGMRRDDLALYSKWLDNPEVTAFLEMGWKPTTEADLETTYREATSDPNAVVLVICDREMGAPIGTTGLYLIHWPCRRAQFRILIGEPSYFDSGCGTEATRLMVVYGFRTLNLETIYLGVNAENARAIRAYEKAGFTVEGRQRQFIYRNGRYYDCVNMSVLRDEYEEPCR